MTQDLAVNFFPVIRVGEKLIVCGSNDILRHEQVQFFPGPDRETWGLVNVLCHSSIVNSLEKNTFANAEDDDKNEYEQQPHGTGFELWKRDKYQSISVFVKLDLCL